MRWIAVVLLVLTLVPSWSGAARLPLLDSDPHLTTRAYVPRGGWPRRVGRLRPVGGLVLSGRGNAFGGYSAMRAYAGRLVLLDDGGNFVSFGLRRGEPRDMRWGYLPGGPGAGWEKRDRDSESLAIDPASGRLWVGFERANAIWRYSPDFRRSEGSVRPHGMRRWYENSGAETLVRLNDGRFLTIAERGDRGRDRPALLFDGDPVDPRSRVRQLRFAAPEGYRATDAAVLPDGDLLVLTRRFRFPLRFSAKIVRVPARSIAPGMVMRGTEIARLAPPFVGENCEGIAVTHERGRTMIWIVTDNDGAIWRPTLLLKFALD